MKKIFFRKLKAFNMARCLTLPTAVFALAVFAALSVLSLYICISTSCCCDACFTFVAAGFSSGVLLFLIILSTKKETTKKSATVLDRLMNTYNSFETSVELFGKGHILEHAQLASSVKLLEEVPDRHLKKAQRFLRMSKEVLAVTLLASLAFAFALPLYSKTDTGALAVIKHAKDKTENYDEANVKASISLTYPDSEINAKPIDEIEWDGSGSVSTSFSRIFLEIFVNGELKKVIHLEKEDIEENNGLLRFSGAFPISDSGAEPFDVVTYHLKGEAFVSDKKVKEIYSQPHFIEIRPLKEDIAVLESGAGGEGDYTAIAEEIKRFIKLQIMLNRITYAARSSGLDIRNEEIRKKVTELSDEQEKLYSKLSKYLSENKDKEDAVVMLTPEMLICLERAAKEMHEAAEKIKKVSGD